MLRDLTNAMPSSSSRWKPSVQQDEDADALPMGPEQAKIELDAIEMRLRQVFNGMRAWSARTGRSIPELEERASEDCDALRRCMTIQQQQGSKGGHANANVTPKPDVQQQGGYPIIVTSSDNTASYSDIFAAPRESAAAAPLPPTRGSRGSLHGAAKGEGVAKWLPKHNCCVAVVEFKRQRMKRCECANMIQPGKYVLVEGDRGYDCGLVIQCAEFNSALGIFDDETQQTIDDEPVDIFRVKDGRLGQVIREASEQEVEQLYSEQASKERVALSTCRELVESLKLPMDVVDCEYQFDGNKISFYFEADHTIDFRALTTQLFRIFNARIWLENVNNSVKNTVPKGAISRNDKVSFEEVGLRLPTTF